MENSLFILITVFVLASCTVTDAQFNKADELCSEHGGVGHLYGTSFSYDIDVICSDGTKMQSVLKSKEVE